jgi:hypothetical protein
LRRLVRLLGWLVVINALIMTFGVATAPLVFLLAIDIAVGWLLVRSCLEQRRYAEGGK